MTVTREAIRTRGQCLVSLSGGSTPRPLYALLASEPHATRIDWSRTHLFWGDERCVGPEQPESNYRMPAQLVKPVRGALHWMVDTAAAHDPG